MLIKIYFKNNKFIIELDDSEYCKKDSIYKWAKSSFPELLWGDDNYTVLDEISDGTIYETTIDKIAFKELEYCCGKYNSIFNIDVLKKYIESSIYFNSCYSPITDKLLDRKYILNLLDDWRFEGLENIIKEQVLESAKLIFEASGLDESDKDSSNIQSIEYHQIFDFEKLKSYIATNIEFNTNYKGLTVDMLSDDVLINIVDEIHYNGLENIEPIKILNR